MRKDFYINDQFLVKPDANLVIDGLISKINRVQPNSMQLLCMLAERNGQTVSGEELVTVTGGDEETLNRHISALRKLLQDEKKELIRTIAQKGYVLNASISNADIDDLRREAKEVATKASAKTASQKWITILSMLIVLLLIIFIFYNYTYSKKTSTSPAEIMQPRPGRDTAAKENEGNSIISLGPDSVIYKLVMADDQTSRFFINNVELPADKWEPHQALISSLKRQLKEKQQQKN